MRIENGSRIAVIGAGPAGSLFAYFARSLAEELGLDVSITLFDAKNFQHSGPSGCNMGAGVISESLVERLKRKDIILPQDKVQRKIRGYHYQSRAGAVRLDHPDGRKRIITVFRGNGPRFFDFDGNISFDDFLFRLACEKGADLVSEPVKSVVLPSRSDDRVNLTYGIQEDIKSFEADLVVGAFGLNSNMVKEMGNLGFGYVPPRSRRACQAEINLDPEFLAESFGHHIYIYSMGRKRIRFSAVVPKKDYISISLIGRKDADLSDFDEFINSDIVSANMPSDWKMPDRFCHCQPHIPATPAKLPYTDRLVIIGDASCSRYYKNGLESAFITAELAANTVFRMGVSRNAFKLGYYKEARKMIIRDNFYGRLLFYINDYISQKDWLAEIFLRLTNPERMDATARRLQEILWNLFSGDIPYRSIFRKALHPRLQIKIFLAITGFPFRRNRRGRVNS